MRIGPLEGVFLETLKKLSEFTGNYGIGIILLTVLIRVIILPLTIKQEKSMKKMRDIQPEIDKLREKHKDNPQEMQIKMQEIYKKNQVNPMAGCLPLFIQMCIFITLFRVLNDANSIPNDATFLWFNLKQPDALVKLPFTGVFSAINIFPLLNTVVTFFQQKMMSTGTQDSNPQMKTMLYTLPLVILVMTYNMPSGVSLYWFTSSLLAVIQQFFIMKGRN
jgi:YidC/Oxa1 family membrane protein insertase